MWVEMDMIVFRRSFIVQRIKRENHNLQWEKSANSTDVQVKQPVFQDKSTTSIAIVIKIFTQVTEIEILSNLMFCAYFLLP